MKLKVLLLLLLSFAFSKTSIGNEDEALFLNNNISKASYITVSNAVISVEQLSAYDENFEIIDVSGVLAKVEPDNGYKIVSELRSKLTDSSNYVYLYDTNFGYREDEIVIFEAKDDLA
ncbi:hypothetical protein [Glaciecola sp. 1036]|uniref:hypothetical protein n=1 Tax=Alteromonadaceae TaxID=72275 RepID=UPI003CFC9CF1